MIEQLKDLNEKNLTLQSQVELTNQRLNEHENLLKESEKKTSLSNQTTNTNDEHEELLAINNKLKCAIETIENKIDQIFTTRADLFGDIGKETNERLDSLISAVENKIALDLNESNDWFDASPEITITDMTEYDRCQDIDIQCELRNIPLSLNHNSTQTDFDSFSFEDRQNKIKELQR
jgi:small-conductance mechanosensitive channel